MTKILVRSICFGAIVIAGICGYTYSQQIQLDPLMVRNVEALSQNEGGDGKQKYTQKFNEKQPCTIIMQDGKEHKGMWAECYLGGSLLHCVRGCAVGGAM